MLIRRALTILPLRLSPLLTNTVKADGDAVQRGTSLQKMQVLSFSEAR